MPSNEENRPAQHVRAARRSHPYRTRAQRRRARTRGRILLATLLLVAGTFVALTDLHGRNQVAQGLRALAVDQHRLTDTRAALVGTELRTAGTFQQVEQIQTTTADNQVSVTDTNTSISTDEAGIFLDGISLPTLNLCLTGIYQSLDQIDVGQASSAVYELGYLGPVCSAVGS